MDLISFSRTSDIGFCLRLGMSLHRERDKEVLLPPGRPGKVDNKELNDEFAFV